MRYIKLMTIATLSFGTFAFGSESLVDALKNGKVSGEVTGFYESRDIKGSVPIPTYTHDSAYATTTLYLAYETAKFKDFSAKVGFRAYSTWEDNKGDSSAHISNKETAALQTAYLAYDTDNIHIKIGRQELATHWLYKRANDAFSAYITPIENLELELIYSKRYAAINERDFEPFNSYGNKSDDTVIKVGLTYDFSDAFTANIYGMDYDTFNKKVYGTTLDYESFYNDIFYGAYIHYANVDDDFAPMDGHMYQAELSAGFAGIFTKIGYLKNKDGALGRISVNKNPATFEGFCGDWVIPFEEGDQLYLGTGDNTTYYAGLFTDMGKVNVGVAYGVTDYNYGPTSPDFSKEELNFRASYNFSEDLSLKLCYATTKEDSSDADTVDVNQLSTSIKYKF